MKSGLIHISLEAGEIKYVEPGKKAVTWQLKISVHEKERNTVHVVVTYFAFGHHSDLNLSHPQVPSLSSLFNSINSTVDLQPNSMKPPPPIFNPDLVYYLILWVIFLSQLKSRNRQGNAKEEILYQFIQTEKNCIAKSYEGRAWNQNNTHYTFTAYLDSDNT